ncbi:MAG: hypothetical protein MUP44_03955, partial [Anaerolineales bacterium]|nr:hypothetical protein [Anaerolineales bacterium]
MGRLIYVTITGWTIDMKMSSDGCAPVPGYLFPKFASALTINCGVIAVRQKAALMTSQRSPRPTIPLYIALALTFGSTRSSFYRGRWKLVH